VENESESEIEISETIVSQTAVLALRIRILFASSSFECNQSLLTTMTARIEWTQLGNRTKDLSVKTLLFLGDGNIRCPREEIAAHFGFTSSRGHDMSQALRFLRQEGFVTKTRNPVTRKCEHSRS